MIKPKTVTIESFIAELRSSLVGKLFEDENGEPDCILLMQKYLDEGRGSSLEQILMGRAIAELVKLRKEMANLTNPSTCFKMGIKEEADSTLYPKGDWRGMARSSTTNGGECLLSIENILNICREDEQNQLAEMIEGQSIATRYESALQKLAQEEADENNKGDMK